MYKKILMIVALLLVVISLSSCTTESEPLVEEPSEVGTSETVPLVNFDPDDYVPTERTDIESTLEAMRTDPEALSIDPTVFYLGEPIEEFRIATQQGYMMVLTDSGNIYAREWAIIGTFSRTADYKENMVPKKIKIPSEVVEFGVGQLTCYAINANNELYMWGSNEHGQLANTEFKRYYDPIKIDLNDEIAVKKAALGLYHTIVLAEDGCLYGWGNNQLAQLGSLDFESTTEITTINLDNVKDIAVTANSSVALTYDGEVYVWGDGSVLIPTNPFFTGIQKVDAGVGRFILLSEEGDVFWGNYHSTVEVEVPAEVVDVWCGGISGYALTATGDVYSWGSNIKGELGIGETTSNYSEKSMLIDFPEPIREVIAGNSMVFAVGQSGQVYGWGKLGKVDPETGYIVSHWYPELINFVFEQSKIQ